MTQNIIVIVQKDRSTFNIIAIRIEMFSWHIEPIVFDTIIAIQVECVQLIDAKIEFIDMHLNALNCYWFW